MKFGLSEKFFSLRFYSVSTCLFVSAVFSSNNETLSVCVWAQLPRRRVNEIRTGMKSVDQKLDGSLTETIDSWVTCLLRSWSADRLRNKPLFTFSLTSCLRRQWFLFLSKWNRFLFILDSTHPSSVRPPDEWTAASLSSSLSFRFVTDLISCCTWDNQQVSSVLSLLMCWSCDLCLWTQSVEPVDAMTAPQSM